MTDSIDRLNLSRLCRSTRLGEKSIDSIDFKVYSMVCCFFSSFGAYLCKILSPIGISLRNMPCMCSFCKMHKIQQKKPKCVESIRYQTKTRIILLLRPLESTLSCVIPAITRVISLLRQCVIRTKEHIIQPFTVITGIVTILHSVFRCHVPRHTIVTANDGQSYRATVSALHAF